MSARLLRDLVVVHVLASVLTGVAWWWLAPPVDYLVLDGRAFPGTETEYVQIIAGDGWFVLLGGVAGAACAAVLLLRRHGGPLLSVGLALGGVLGSVGAWGLGVLLGPGRLADLVATAEEGAVVTAGPELRAYGALLVWPIVALVVALVAASVSAPARRSEPSPPG
jgi:hypothetical protein